MKEFPYFEVNQNDEVFLMTRMPISFLLETVNFHFRSPYQEESVDFENSIKYIEKLKKDTNIHSSNIEEGVQRRTDLKRIDQISDHIVDSKGIIFPTPIVLCMNVFTNKKFENKYEFDLEKNKVSFSNDIEFTIIDGQHRLAGLAKAYNETKNDIQMPITLILNADISVATQLFIDINGNQKKVNRSVIYDLYKNIDNKQMDSVVDITDAVSRLNFREKSPLFNRIKILGVGTGTISQAFLVDYIQIVLKEILKFEKNSIDVYKLLYSYFTIISRTYPSAWEKNSRAKDDSQLVKTNGMGALLLLLPELYKDMGSPYINTKAYSDYFGERSEFDWDKAEYNGTGKKQQNIIKNDLSKI